MSSRAFRFYHTCLIIINLKNLSKNGLERARNRCIQPTRNTHTLCSIPKQNLSQTNCSKCERRFSAKMLQYSTPVSQTTKYFLQLFFLQFKYFQIRQLENLGAKRRTPFARNFSHFERKEVKLNRDLADPNSFNTYYVPARTISNILYPNQYFDRLPKKRRQEKTNIEG